MRAIILAFIISVACRRCAAGWYGQAGDLCPRCGESSVVTGQFCEAAL